MSTKTYVPRQPRFQINTTTAPCRFENKNSSKQFNLITCERTEVPNLNRCSIKRATNGTVELIPRECITDTYKVLNNVKSEQSFDSQGNVTQTITPTIDVYSATRYGKRTGPVVSYNKEQETQIAQPLTKMDLIRPAFNQTLRGQPVYLAGGNTNAASTSNKPKRGRPQSKKTGGSSSVSSSAAALSSAAPSASSSSKNAGVDLPSRRHLRRSQLVLTQPDINTLMVNSGSFQNFIPLKPSDAAKLPFPNSDELFFYQYDDDDNDGLAASENVMKYGVKVPARYLPFAYAVNEPYFEWLIRVAYELRTTHSAFMKHVYDSALDTIAILETAILVALGRMEEKGQIVDRKRLFRDADKHKSMMNRALQKYAFEPPTRVWVSPISLRYKEPKADPTKVTEELIWEPLERETLGNITTLNDSILDMAKANNIKLRGRYLSGGRDLSSSDDSLIMGVVEDEFLSMLARLQYTNGYAVNLSYNQNNLNDIATLVLQPIQSRYLEPFTKSYLESFMLESPNEPFIRLSGIILDEARSQGLIASENSFDLMNAMVTGVPTTLPVANKSTFSKIEIKAPIINNVQQNAILPVNNNNNSIY
jgi:hypothetical protein